MLLRGRSAAVGENEAARLPNEGSVGHGTLAAIGDFPYFSARSVKVANIAKAGARSDEEVVLHGEEGRRRPAGNADLGIDVRHMVLGRFR